MRTLYRQTITARNYDAYEPYGPIMRPYHLRLRAAQYRRLDALDAALAPRFGTAWMTGSTAAVYIPAPNRSRRPIARNRRK